MERITVETNMIGFINAKLHLANFLWKGDEHKWIISNNGICGLTINRIVNPQKEREIEILREGKKPLDSGSMIKLRFTIFELRYSWDKGKCSSLRKSTKHSSM